jgi:hypothetical protein
MAQSGYTPILIYASGTASNVPSASNLTSSSAGAELALNYADGKLYYKNSSGVVTLLASSTTVTNSFSAGTTGFTPNTATTGAVTLAGTLITSNGGTGLSSYTAGDITYYASGTALSKLGIGTNGQILTSTGSAPQWSTLSGVAVTTFQTSLSGLTPSTATSGAITLAGTLGVANGGTGLTSLTAGYIPYGNGTSAFSNSSNLYFSGSKLGVNTASPAVTAAFVGTDAILLPKGGTSAQPTGVAGYLRFNTDTSQFEGYNGTTWSSVGGAAISNDTSTATFEYPVFASATSGTALTIYTSNAKYLYQPSTGELQAYEINATNGLLLNNATVSASYTIASGTNALSVGPITVASGQSVTVPSGSRWVVL